MLEREIAPARTFVFYEDVQPLMENNLLKGGSLHNEIVMHGEAIQITERLPLAAVFVRHKILDIIGDLTPVVRLIRAHVVAIKPGHASNAELARTIAREQTQR